MSCGFSKRIACLAVVLAIALAGIFTSRSGRVLAAEARPEKESFAATGADRPSVELTSRDRSLANPLASLLQPGDWNQWGGSPVRNNVPDGKNILTDWKV